MDDRDAIWTARAQLRDAQTLTVGELTRLRKIEAAAQALSNFNGGLFEFNIRLRTLKAAVETDTDD
jgi:hypothetical protein